MAMGSNGKTFKTVVFEDGTHAVVRTDPHEPRFLEVVAIFHDASRARSYADIENDQYPARAELAPREIKHLKQHRKEEDRRADWGSN